MYRKVNRCVFFQSENVEPTADWFTEEPTQPTQTSRTTPGTVEEVDENNSLDEGVAAPTVEAEDVLPTGDLENEIVAVGGRGRGWIHTLGRAIGDEVTSENMWERQEVLAGEDDL